MAQPARRTRRARIAAVAICTLTVAAFAGACGGGGDDDGGEAAAGETLQGRAVALITCLNDAGARASERETTPFGVESVTQGVTVAGLDQADEAQVWLFETAAEAEEARPAITLTNQDDLRNALVGRTVVRFNNVPSETERTLVTGCLVAPVA